MRDKALLRGLIHAASLAIQKAYDQDAPAEEIVDAAESAIFQIAEKRIGQGFMGIPEIVKSSFGSSTSSTNKASASPDLKRTLKIWTA